MLQNLFKVVGAFILGGSVTLFFEQAMEGVSMIVLILVMILGGGLSFGIRLLFRG